MAILDIFSKRKAREKGEVPDVYKYDVIPQRLRVQCMHVFRDVLKIPDVSWASEEHREAYRTLVGGLRKEYGVFALSEAAKYDIENYPKDFYAFLAEAPTERFIDAVELGMNVVKTFASRYSYSYEAAAAQLAQEAIEEINHRFRENGVGYEYVGGKIIRIDSKLLHKEVVKPALSFLSGKMYSGAEEEYLSAHSHYKEGKYKEAIVDCLKSFESTMKAICDKRKWSYARNSATAKELISVCLQNGLIPSYWQSSVNSLRSLLESSVPTGRNKVAGHGQGAAPKQVEEPVVKYILYMTASTILFLTEAERELP